MIIVGHRGARGLASENTLKALTKGVEYKVNELEVDLRVTKDQVVILNHDEFLHDPSGDALLIKDHKLSELIKHKPDLLVFSEMMKALKPTTSLYLEVKPNEPVKQIIIEIKKALNDGWPKDKIKLASFSQEILADLHYALPDLDTIVLERWSSFKARHRASALDTVYLSMNQRYMWFGFIKLISRRGYRLYAYTLNDPKKAKKWAKYGLYGVVTDYPDKFVKL
jgi:glycerophosphoryl diester phosphodiesterase